jgi:hypothetical protein
MTGWWIAGRPLALLQQATSNESAEQLRQQIALEAIRHRGAGGVLVPLAFFAMILAIVWLAMRKRQAQIRARSEFHKQLLDKFASGKEFAEFLESKGSQRFLEELGSLGGGPYERTLGSLRAGVILAVLGLGFFALSLMRRGFMIPGVIIFALGVGFLLAAAISHRLAKQWNQERGAGPGITRT